MDREPKWGDVVRRLERLLRLRSFPVGLKMLARREELERIPFLRRPSHQMTLCQLITLVRNFDWTVGADLDDFIFATCPSILGLCEVPEGYRDGTFRSIVWVQTKEDGRRYEAAIPRLPVGRYQAVALAPLVYDPFQPDMVLVYGNPAQMILLVNALQFSRYEVMHFHCVGESSCADAIARCWLEGKASLAIPCYGERRYGHAQDDELVMALPPQELRRAVEGLEALYRRGVRYPISQAGAELEVSPALPPAYRELNQRVPRLRGWGGRLVVGLTGGIASGKSSVARMLAQHGAYLIDFDQLARQVVEPGQPAYREIVDYFGRQVLAPDGTLDRKALGEVVFRDLEKRKKLESFTHPRIFAAFHHRLEEIGRQDPRAVVVAEVPLLIELNLCYLFDRVVLVYAPPEAQVRRLMQREGITRQEAEERLRAQLPIDQKRGYAQHVIDNRGSPEDTAAQVEALWRELNRNQGHQP